MSMSAPEIRPYHLAIPQAALDDLNDRLARTRWPETGPVLDWSYGPPLAYMRDLVDYWRSGYDWRAAEAKLNALPQFTTEIDRHAVHFIHTHSPEPDAIPLLLTHGWAGSILEFTGLLGPLTDPRAHGGDPADAFHVVIASPPGFGLSGPTRDAGWSVKRVARAWAVLMQRLGYDRYVAHGGDFGSLISRELGLIDSEHLMALNITLLPAYCATYQNIAELDADDPEVQRSLAASQRYEYELGGYGAIQGTRPQLIGYGLNDSPVLQLAWLIDIFRNWTDITELPEEAIDRDTLLTNAMLYWLTGTGASSARYYRDGLETWGEPEEPLAVPMAITVLPRDNFAPVRQLAERDNAIVRWTELPRGGHFPGLEVPDLLVDELRESFRPYRSGRH
ncbi:MAG: epoxide hydrolase [Thermomicrobiales bacterium]